MAYFAEIDDTSTVLRVISVSNDDAPGITPTESEPNGQAFIANVLGLPGTWKQASYNTISGQHTHGGTPLRYNFASVGFAFSEDERWSDQHGAFIPPQPYSSWVLDDSCTWQAPVPYPTDGDWYRWDEDTLSWVEVPA